MEKKVPKFLEDMLLEDYGEKLKNEIINGYKKYKKVTFRVNTLKANKEKIKSKLKEEKIIHKEVNWYEDAFIIENVKEDVVQKLDIYEKGEIYLQSLSSMIPPLILEPKENENILDMAAAPGGKTTELAALSHNEAMITACEKNKIRLEKLKYNIERQGARVNILMEDSRRLDDFFSFDKILLDSPCSGSGTENIYNEKFTKELVERSRKTQIELLKKGINILKPGGEMIYSTCSVLKTENEEVLKLLLKTGKIEIVKIEESILKEVPKLPSKVEGTICIAPNELYEGFFIAKIRRRN